MEILKTDSKAYFDSFSGLIPCKVLSVVKGEFGIKVKVKLTKGQGSYKKFEKITESSLHIIPRKSIKYYGGNARILPFNVECDKSIEQKYKTGYSPLFDCVVNITHSYYNDDRLFYYGSNKEKGLKDHIFSDFELKNLSE